MHLNQEVIMFERFRNLSRRNKLVASVAALIVVCCGCLALIIAIPLPESDITSDDATNATEVANPAEETAVEVAESPVEETVSTTTEETVPTTTPGPTNTATAIPTSTFTPTPTPLYVGFLTVRQNANLRAGPGSDYEVVGSANGGDELPIYGRNTDGTWLQVDEDGLTWIWAELVDLPLEIASIPVPPSPTPTNTPTGTPTPNLTATARIENQNATSTARAQANANATATVEAFVDFPPIGTWCAQNDTRGFCVGDFRYERRAGFTNAPSNGRFIAFGVAVRNLSGSSISVNPFDLTLVMADGRTYEHASQSYSYWAIPLQSVTLASNGVAEGGMVFLVPNDVAPRYLIYRGGLFESEIELDLYDPPISTDDE